MRVSCKQANQYWVVEELASSCDEYRLTLISSLRMLLPSPSPSRSDISFFI